MTPERKHRILLINFCEAEAASVAKAGFTVECGYIGAREKRGTDWVPYHFPRPLYEYEVSVYNSRLPDQEEMARLCGSVKNLLTDKSMFEPFLMWQTLPATRIAFTGVPSGFGRLTPAGLPSIGLRDAHEGVSIFETHVDTTTFSIPELGKLIASFRHDIAAPVGQYASWAEKVPYPFNHYPVIINRNGDEIASYGSVYEKRNLPVYVILPQLKNNANALVKLLELVAHLRPELFPDREVREWFTSDDFAFAEENAIKGQIDAKIKETIAFIEKKRAEKAEVAQRYSFIKKILVAREDAGLAPEDKLSTNVQKVLEFLGFEVEDIDAKIRGAIRKEDFWVKEGREFLAITEVTGTNAKNPKTKEYNDLLGRMTTIFKRRDLVPDASKISGLLVVNYDIDTHARKRPRLYSGEAEEIVAAAKDQNIGLLSTVELYDIAIAAKDNLITREEARRLIKQFGRIEFKGKKPE